MIRGGGSGFGSRNRIGAVIWGRGLVRVPGQERGCDPGRRGVWGSRDRSGAVIWEGECRSESRDRSGAVIREGVG